MLTKKYLKEDQGKYGRKELRRSQGNCGWHDKLGLMIMIMIMMIDDDTIYQEIHV